MRYVLERGVRGPSLSDAVYEIVDTAAHPRCAVARGLTFRFGVRVASLLEVGVPTEEPVGLTDEERDRYDTLLALVRGLTDFAEPRSIDEERTVDEARAVLEEADA